MASDLAYTTGMGSIQVGRLVRNERGNAFFAPYSFETLLLQAHRVRYGHHMTACDIMPWAAQDDDAQRTVEAMLRRLALHCDAIGLALALPPMPLPQRQIAQPAEPSQTSPAKTESGRAHEDGPFAADTAAPQAELPAASAQASAARVGDIMRTELITVEPQETGSTALAIMKRHRLDIMPVTEGTRLVGSVSQQTLQSAGADADGPVTELMDRQLLVSDEATELPEAAQAMGQHGAEVLWITTADGAVMGAVTIFDMLAAVSNLIEI